MLQQFNPLITARTWPAAWRTLWNGWIAHRRFPGTRGFGNHCMFCGTGALDDIEHYASCPHVWSFARSLGLPRTDTAADCLVNFLLLDLALDGLRLEPLYRVYCLARHGVVPVGAAAREDLHQSGRELARGRPVSQRAHGHWC